MDITDFMDFFVNLMLDGFADFYDILSSIKFWGIDLFEFTLSVFLVGVVFTLLISIARNGAGKVSRVIIKAEHGGSKGGKGGKGEQK